MTNIRTVCALALPALFSCGREGDSYVFLADLCSSYAEDVCSARANCCDADAELCRDEVSETCEAARDELVQRSQLSYNASHASDARARSLESLVGCGAPLAVSAFFDGTLPLDAACSDDLACALGRCEIDGDADSGVCAALDESLCGDP